MEAATGIAPQCGECGKVELHPANLQPWETYWRVHDQIDTWSTKDNKQYVSLRAEAVAAVLRFSSSPLEGEDRGEGDAEIYDRVLLIHNIRHGQYSPNNA